MKAEPVDHIYVTNFSNLSLNLDIFIFISIDQRLTNKQMETSQKGIHYLLLLRV